MPVLSELDQNTDAEARTLRVMCDQLQAIRRRYPSTHPVGESLDTLIAATKATQQTLLPYCTAEYKLVVSHG